MSDADAAFIESIYDAADPDQKKGVTPPYWRPYLPLARTPQVGKRGRK
jgi:hypothetical protein